MTTSNESGQPTPRRRLAAARRRRGWGQVRAAIEINQRGLWLGYPEDELRVDAHALSRWERGVHEPQARYVRIMCSLYEMPADQLDLAPPVAEHVNTATSAHATAALAPTAAPQLATVAAYDPDEVERREFIERGLALIGSATSAELHTDLPFRLLRAISRPGALDEATIVYLHSRVSEQWRVWSSQALPSRFLLPFVYDDLHRLSTLLEGSLAATPRAQLTSATGSLAMLAGVLLWDQQDYSQSRTYLRTAIAAAHESENRTLQAVAHGWTSFAWSYSGHSRETQTEALYSVRAARSLEGVRMRVRLWLAAIEAEVHAGLGDERTSTAILKQTESSVLSEASSDEDDYWTNYDAALVSGYKGACYLRLRRPQQAQEALLQALGHSSESGKRVISNLYVDLGRAYAMDGHVEEACVAAAKALDVGTKLDSGAKVQRLDALLQELQPWQDTRAVRELIERLATAPRTRS